MSKCTFFGHRDCSESVMPALEKVLIDLIENEEVADFYVGNQGAFDRIVRTVLKKLSLCYPHIRYTVVLAYMPGTSMPEGFLPVFGHRLQ